MPTYDSIGAAESRSYCGHCGLAAHVVAESPCSSRLTMEPPRYCSQCRRRMKVQVDPFGWSAACSRHGTVAS